MWRIIYTFLHTELTKLSVDTWYILQSVINYFIVVLFSKALFPWYLMSKLFGSLADALTIKIFCIQKDLLNCLFIKSRIFFGAPFVCFLGSLVWYHISYKMLISASSANKPQGVTMLIEMTMTSKDLTTVLSHLSLS